MIKFVSFLILSGLFISSVQANEIKKEISTKTAVIFNTLCAMCHEGECSGRLSFQSGYKKAQSHIKRYVENVNISEGETKEFFMLLDYMKKECALLMPDDGAWKQENLSRFALPSHRGYFIPLGDLDKGKYHLAFTTKEHVLFQVEVISDHFEPYLDRSVCPGQEEYSFSFSVDKTANSFVRIRSKKPLHLLSLEVKKQDR